MVFIVAIFLSASVGLKNFKLNASEDASSLKFFSPTLAERKIATIKTITVIGF